MGVIKLEFMEGSNFKAEICGPGRLDGKDEYAEPKIKVTSAATSGTLTLKNDYQDKPNHWIFETISVRLQSDGRGHLIGALAKPLLIMNARGFANQSWIFSLKDAPNPSTPFTSSLADGGQVHFLATCE